ncbi:MAG TPA: hypothetical protein VLH77_01340 [Gammaproteobacteria bacterium]|nr:hypothetical protein [Gammaproteobacteria bacterium]
MGYLYVGGPRDGKIFDGDMREYIHVATRILDSLSVKTEIYKLQHFRGEKEEFFIYAYDKMTGDEVIRKLIEGYKPDAPNAPIQS